MEDYKTPDSIALYAWARPSYPIILHRSIIDWLSNGMTAENNQRGQKFKLALDVGCGAGQSTSWLCDRFEAVIGVDPSQEQIEAARNNVVSRNVTFRTGVAHDLSFLADNSVDLITAATAMHWFKMEEFCAETHRVLRQGGVLAAYCHVHDKDMVLQTGPSISVKKDIMVYEELPPESVHLHVFNRYRDLQLVIENHFPCVQRQEYAMESAYYNVDAFRGYIQSILMFSTPAEMVGGLKRLDKLTDRIVNEYRNDPKRDVIRADWDVFVILARKQ